MQPDPKVALVIITDGRGDYLARTLDSLGANLQHRFVSRTIVDDSGDPAYAAHLDAEYPTFDRIHHPERRGLGNAVETAWKTALDSDAAFVWHQEEDFTIDEPVDVPAMAETLDQWSNLAQLSLKRQPVNATEVTAGGYMQVEPARYANAEKWVDHDVCFSLNPSLIPRSVIESCVDAEMMLVERPITDYLLKQGLRFGVWGSIEDPPRVTHIGTTRSPGWRV